MTPSYRWLDLHTAEVLLPDGETCRVFYDWQREGWTFQRVSAAPYDFVVELATAATTDYICGKYGIHTAGQVNCRGGQNVVLNLDRWEQGTNAFQAARGDGSAAP